MRLAFALLLGVTLLTLAGCYRAADGNRTAENKEPLYQRGATARPQSDPKHEVDALAATVPLDQANSANNSSQAVDRKIIRNANLSLEVASPAETQRKIASIAESHQGFVVTSEATERTSEDKSKPEITISLTVRVPAAQFNQAMEEIRATGLRVTQEKITGQDVTEEFIDLEARIRNQKALEAQFIEIMKRAGKVEDALSVQRELANVRTEIERLEGRRRFLENQSSLSTITVTLQPPTQIVNAAGFWYSLKSAFADGVDVAGAIVLFLIRAVVALLPVLLLIVLPFTLIVRFIVKRVTRKRIRKDADRVIEETP